MRYETTITDATRGTERTWTYKHNAYVGSALVDEAVIPIDHQVAVVRRVAALGVGQMAFFQNPLGNSALVKRVA